MRRKHLLSEKLPLLSMLLAFAATMIAASLEFTQSKPINNLITSIIAVICMLIQWKWFSPEYKGPFKAVVPAREIMIVSIPFFAKFFLSYFLNVIDFGWYFNFTFLNLTMGIAAGFYEEAIVRGVTIPIGMRYLKGENRCFKAAVITSLVFGLIHLGNIAEGASIQISVIQAIATTFVGLLFAAVFLRTGSILISIFMHGIFDWMCFVTDSSLVDGVMVNTTISPGLIAALAVDIAAGVAGLYMIRPAVREKIEDVWHKKWDLDI